MVGRKRFEHIVHPGALGIQPKVHNRRLGVFPRGFRADRRFDDAFEERIRKYAAMLLPEMHKSQAGAGIVGEPGGLEHGIVPR